MECLYAAYETLVEASTAEFLDLTGAALGLFIHGVDGGCAFSMRTQLWW